MKLPRRWIILTVASVALLVSSFSFAGVSQQKAERLKKDLTPLGAERAGKAEGTIPAWDGGMTEPPAGVNVKPGDFLPDPFKDDKVVFTITAQNMDQYADRLTEGTRWLLKRYPDTFRIDVYPSRRPQAAPQWVYDNTYKNALDASSTEDRLGVQKAYGGIPFPIPEYAEQIMFNHFCRWQGASRKSLYDSFTVNANGSLTIINGGENYENYPYYFQGEPDYNVDIWKLYITSTKPARKKGELTLVIDSVNPQYTKRKAWQYLPGQRRVRRAPTLSYDNPNPSSTITVYDDSWMYNGALDRFDWKIIGKKEMYIPYNNYALHLVKPEEFAMPGHFNPALARWELHRVWVVEATLKEGERHQYGRRVFYVDEDSWIVSMKDQYDNRNDFWRFTIGMNYHDYTLPGVISTPWLNFDVTVPFWVWEGSYYGQAHFVLNREKETNPTEYYTPAYLRKAGRR